MRGTSPACWRPLASLTSFHRTNTACRLSRAHRPVTTRILRSRASGSISTLHGFRIKLAICCSSGTSRRGGATKSPYAVMHGTTWSHVTSEWYEAWRLYPMAHGIQHGKHPAKPAANWPYTDWAKWLLLAGHSTDSIGVAA